MIDNVGVIGTAFNSFTAYVSGDEFFTLFLLLMLFFFFGLMFRINLEWLSIILVPVVIYFMSLDARFYPVGGLLLLFVAFIIIRNFWFQPR
jgi:hypothetical protein